MILADSVDIQERPVVAIHIADNGPGVPDTMQEEILQKGISRSDAPGNGLGLYLVKEMMRAYGGDVIVRDREQDATDDRHEGGTVFDLCFLRAERDETT